MRRSRIRHLEDDMRDYRIDFFRGLALIVIFVDHIPFNIYSYLTPRNFGLSDAAETFVLVSGISAAYAYFGRFASGEKLLAGVRAVRRGFTLYVAHLFGTMAMLGMFAAAALWFAEPSFIEQNNLRPVFSDPVRGLAGVVTLGHQLGFFNILPMYVVFLFALPALMLLASRSLALMLMVSFLIYIVAGTYRLNFPAYPNQGGWFFDPLAWQFLFAIGFAAGVKLRSGAAVSFSPWLWYVALAYLALSAAWAVIPLWGTLPELDLPFVIYGSDKTFLTMGRLLHALALAYVVGNSAITTFLGARLGASNPVVLLGKHALVTFVLGTLVSMAGLILKVALEGGPVFDTIYVASGLLLLVAVALSLEEVRSRKVRLATRGSPGQARTIDAPLTAAE
jgi:hypothetical protein